MANTRISNLTASASDLAAADVLPVVQTTGVGPVKMTGTQIKTGIIGAGSVSIASGKTFTSSNTLTLAGTDSTTMTFPSTSATIARTDAGNTFTGAQAFSAGTSSAPVINAGTSITNGSATGIFFTGNGEMNFTSHSSGTGVMRIGGGPQVQLNSTVLFGWGALSGGQDLNLTRAAAATLQLGAADAAAPVAQTFKVQSVVAGTTNTAGTNFTIQGSQGTGTGAGGSIIFQVAPAGSSGTAQNAYSTALTIASNRNATFGSDVTSGNDFLSGRWVRDTSSTYLLRGEGIITNSAGYFSFSSGSNVIGNPGDVFLYRDAANTLALRNGTSAQLFRVYSTYNGTNDAYGAIGAAVNLDGTAGDANTLYIGSQKKGSPTALTKLAIQVDGTTRFDYNGANANTWTLTTASSTYTFDNSGGLNGLVSLRFLTTNGGTISGYINVSTSGVFLLRDGAASSFDRLQFGGTTSSFPALKRVSANLQVIAADNTASAGFIVGNQALATSATDGFLYVPTCAGTPTGTPTTQTGTAPIVVDSTNNKLYFYSGGQWRDAGP